MNCQFPVESNISISIPFPNPIYPKSVKDRSISFLFTYLGSILYLCLDGRGKINYGVSLLSASSSSLSTIYKYFNLIIPS